MIEYISVIKDECGDIICVVMDRTESEIKEILSNHPEWYISCEEVCI